MPRLLTVLCALFWWAPAAPAADFAALKPEGYVSDYARVVDPALRAALEKYCEHVETRTGAQIAAVTLDTLGGEPIEDVANALFRTWGIGKKGKNEGALLLLVTRDRRMRLEVGYGLEPVIPDGFAGSILRGMRPSLREQRYGEALMEGVRTLGSRIAEAKGVSLDEALPRRTRRQAPSIPWQAVIGIVILLWALGAGARRMGGGGGGGSGTGLLLGMLAGNMLGRAMGSGRGGGGFGGFDSGGGFGGFGGGDSGGGGASGDW